MTQHNDEISLRHMLDHGVEDLASLAGQRGNQDGALLPLALDLDIANAFVSLDTALENDHQVVCHANEVSLLRTSDHSVRPGLRLLQLVLLFIEDLLDVPSQLV